MEKLNINQWALEDRPREKFMAHGAEALSKAELLAILIGSGTPKESAVSLMQRILNDCEDNLNTLGKMSLEELMSYHGIGEAKAITILAACELGKRRQLEDVQKRESISCAADIYTYLHSKMQDCDTEQAWIMLLNQNFKLIKAIRISSGGITETSVDIRIIFREAVLANATIIAVCHNHPSGSLTPSHADNELTRSIQRACELMHIRFMDHVIITDGLYYSYHEHGKC